jgi:hypothetical protein
MNYYIYSSEIPVDIKENVEEHFEFQEEEFPQLSNPIKVGVIYLEIFIVGAKNSMFISDLTLNCYHGIVL